MGLEHVMLGGVTEMIQKDDPRLNAYCSISEACEILQISRNTIYRQIRQGAPTHPWTAGRQRIIPSEWISWIEQSATENRVKPMPVIDLAKRRKDLAHAIGN